MRDLTAVTLEECLLLFGHQVLSHSLQPHELKTCQVSLSVSISWSLSKFIATELVMPSNHLILCHPLLCPQHFPASGSFCSFRGKKKQTLVIGHPGSPQNMSWFLCLR